MSDALSQAALAICSVLFASWWEGAIVVAAVWLCLHAFPMLGASTRYAVWLSTLVMLLIAPVCTVAFSQQHATQAVAAPANAVVTHQVPAALSVETKAAPYRVERDAIPPLPASLPAAHRQRLDVPLWLSVATAVLCLLLAVARLLRLIINLGGLIALRESAQILRVAYGYPVLSSKRTDVPLAIGFVKPAVVLPSALSGEHSAPAIDAIVMHEVAHLRRYDVWTNALSRVLEALLSLNPLAWFVLARLSVEREIACDDWVVAQLDAGEVFANALANMALRRSFTSIAAPSAIGSKNAVVTRIERLLERRPRRLRLSGAALTGILLLLAIFTTFVPTVSPVLAFTPSAALAAAGTCTNAPPMMRLDKAWLRSIGPWIPLKYDPRVGSDPRSTVTDLTIGANGKLNDIVVIRTPHGRDAKAAKWYFGHSVYRAAVVNCKPAAATVRVAEIIDIAAPQAISIVRAQYPNGWSDAHPGACRIPDLTHGGIPSVHLINTRTVNASALVRVDASGKVTGATLTKSSGNTAYDNATLAAARAGIYPLAETTGFKPVRPSGATLAWNATHGYSAYSKCTPRPAEYVWDVMFPPADT